MLSPSAPPRRKIVTSVPSLSPPVAKEVCVLIRRERRDRFPVVATALWAVCARPKQRGPKQARVSSTWKSPDGPQGRGYNSELCVRAGSSAALEGRRSDQH